MGAVVRVEDQDRAVELAERFQVEHDILDETVESPDGVVEVVHLAIPGGPSSGREMRRADPPDVGVGVEQVDVGEERSRRPRDLVLEGGDALLV